VRVPRHRSPAPAAALAAILALAALTAACRRPAPHFSEANARAHVNRLAGDIGSRPAGTDNNRRAREYLVEQLRFHGFAVRVQETEARRPEHGLSARVANIIAVLPGARAEAIGVLAHYDSRFDTPGAADDALGVAVCLELARLQAARRDRQHAFMVLLTDAEENGLMGAAALVEDPEVRSRLQVYLNLEATGSAGPVLLFEAGPGNGWAVRAWAAASPRPRGGSYQFEVYRRLPNDTDFTVLRQAGIPGLNFAAVGDSYAYHTALDTPERLARDGLLQAGENALAIVEALDRRTITERTREQPVYFDVGATYALAMSPAAAGVLAWAAIVLATVAWLRILLRVGRTAGVSGVVVAFAWALMAVVLLGATLVGATWLLRSVREVYHPWYAHPGRLWLLMVTSAVLAARLLVAVAGVLPPGLRPFRHPAVVWTVTLPPWIAGAAAMQVLAPAAAYLWVVPLAAAVCLTLPAPSLDGRAAQLASLLVGIVSWTLWLPDVHEALRFAVPLLGRLPLVTPSYVFPAAFLLAGAMVVPPALAMLAAAPGPAADTGWRGRPARPLVTPVLGLACALAFAAAYLADAYTPERPLRRSLQYVADHASERAGWEIGSNEPGLGITAVADTPAGWTHERDAVLGDVPVPMVPHPFRMWAPAALEAPPFAVAARVSMAGDGVTIELEATPAEPGRTVLFILPPDVTPASATLPGIVRGGRWIAAYAAAPATPLVLRALLPDEAADRLAEVRVGLVAPGVPGVPGGDGARGLPAWAGEAAAVWSARSLHLVAPFPVAPLTPLR
jgi:hypothetical protein